MPIKYRSDISRRTITQGDDCIYGYYDPSHPSTHAVLNAAEAAKVFAHREARRIYGKRGFCHHVRLDLRTERGNWFLYEAFIGVPVHGGCTGKNIRFTVTEEHNDNL